MYITIHAKEPSYGSIIDAVKTLLKYTILYNDTNTNYKHFQV